ncbi:hypothetical protein BX616_007990 [Lobosporangium transversale]|uniref:BZIP domain-containing protein n=1 Tax=Lobosporangium transversale TaxID=64571 RepID=A0A1Y2GJE2_9FUNG|nr:hypothetical protein BCR41DRAFT_356325 [Lobosporangium transversale]KAF9918547.1 hypothetical protein BX616_007990 [Lobosporangium transversale]ORZ12579.1 hypothetical protein BCR41DRAFT_356325 [Lobosporangium transversale]|eukprot:XP_021880198.1 hypothetical protein BCR41DRAFT_356325 [Lobosporangium transversale]
MSSHHPSQHSKYSCTGSLDETSVSCQRKRSVEDQELDQGQSQNYDREQGDNGAITTTPVVKKAATSPELRKEQNRAAQRAFRDRKERHLQQLENMIRDLKDQQVHMVTRFRREVTELNSRLETTMLENQYLREVVFAFETALCKGGHVAVLQDVKQELYRHHNEKHAQTHQAKSDMARNIGSDATAQHDDFSEKSTIPSKEAPHPLTLPLTAVDPTHDILSYTVNREILYRAPPLFVTVASDDGKITTIRSPTEPLSAPRPSFVAPGTHLPKHTDYTKHPTVFDELQSSLFPPGTLESLVQSGMATPQEVVNDSNTFFEQIPSNTAVMGDDHGYCSATTTTNSQRVRGEGGIKNYATKVGLVNGNHRLQKEFYIMATSPPAVDPNISPQIYEIPHDSRIDLIPCPKLRAQMILHQNKYNIDELFQLLLDKAICHGPPMDVHSWELPDEFFDRFGFLMGLDMERIRRKVWPRKAL